MATPKSSFHNRSISLPSTSHPLDASIENHIRRLRVSQAGPSSSLSQNLCSVKELHEQMNDLIHLQHNQQVLSNEHKRVEVEEILDGSLVTLDFSSSILDALSQMKESIMDLKSAFRRGSNDEGIHAFLVSRKKVKKMLFKCLAILKKSEESCSLKQRENDESIMRVLKDAEIISLATLKSLLSYMMGKKKVSQTRGWSLVNKLVKSKNLSHDSENATEVENLDYALCKNAESKVVMKQLETLEIVILKLEESLESVSRCFVKTRVSLLNVLNH
ncbi:hypothetical protein BVRB_011940 [Beta vulgaris subsp. vulgaris]|uniref:DUF241 domain-containing protein n=1 Tax=Beta vulgaris subsp. vulgaris TaxID=3555 RepID=A0A0J8B5H6_BETVV|nr:uncharacterized protein LOC104884774 [Beta vulgaris subsp. vulgaris]KMS95143.1 hypothetical protein BVRB_011940 [Beta vulgaris subsp. vulgaris]